MLSEVSAGLTQPAHSEEFAIAQARVRVCRTRSATSPARSSRRRASQHRRVDHLAVDHEDAGTEAPASTATRPLQFRETRHQCLVDRLDLARMDAQQPAEAHVASEAHCLDQSDTVLDRQWSAVQRRRQACQARLRSSA